jgi:acyl-coenzyme A thioesterase PaaI-like protein
MHERLRGAAQRGDLGPLLAAIPYVQFLGISTEVVGGALITKLAFSDMLVGNPTLPALHGGTIGALLESAAVFQLLWESQSATLPKIITITVDYLRSARPVDTWAKAVITRQGRRVANVRVEAWQDDPARLVATGSAHFLLAPLEGADGA